MSLRLIDAIECFSFDIPMQRHFEHASHTHTSSKGVLVKVTSGDCEGWGEAAPRAYVTGESVDSVFNDLQQLDVKKLRAGFDIANYQNCLDQLIDLEGYFHKQPGPSSLCALELALLDLVLKHHQLHLEQFLADLHGRKSDVLPVGRYVYAIGLADADEELERLHKTSQKAPAVIKIKANNNFDALEKTLIKVRSLFADTTLCLDANEGWTPQQLLSVGGMLKKNGVAWVEEPLPARSWQALKTFRKEVGIPVLLDESFSSREDAIRGDEQEAYDALNIRLSKCGGVIRSLNAINLANALNKGFYFGVHVGEVGPLWVAQRKIALCFPGAWGMEVGKQDIWFEAPTTLPEYSVDRSLHQFTQTPGFGLGVVPSPFLLKQLVARYSPVLI